MTYQTKNYLIAPFSQLHGPDPTLWLMWEMDRKRRNKFNPTFKQFPRTSWPSSEILAWNNIFLSVAMIWMSAGAPSWEWQFLHHFLSLTKAPGTGIRGVWGGCRPTYGHKCLDVNSGRFPKEEILRPPVPWGQVRDNRHATFKLSQMF